MKKIDIDITTLSTETQKQMEYVRSVAPFYSSGVFAYDDGECHAWINYLPPYEQNGGSWWLTGGSPEEAIANLYEAVSHYLQAQATY